MAPGRLKEHVTESAFQSWVRDTARACGWLAYHTNDSRRSDKGFPDLVLVKGSVLLAAELKTDRGKLSDEQVVWLRRLNAVPGVVAFVWRPRDRSMILDILKGRQDGDNAYPPR